MLKQRILTAVVFAGLVLGVVLAAPPWLTMALFALLVLGGALEWSALAGMSEWSLRVLHVVLTGVVMALGLYALGSVAYPEAERLVTLIGPVLMFWVLAALAVKAYPAGVEVWGGRWMLSLIGMIVLVPPWLAAVYLRALPHGEYLLIYVIALIACADIGAFFAGRAVGGAKLMPRVSPGKTWAGFAGGMTASLAFSLAVGVWMGFSPARLAMWCMLGLLTMIASVFGDLLESAVKRHGGMKDSGSLLPGHGGLLDRLDSLSAGLPVFAYVLAQTGMV